VKAKVAVFLVLTITFGLFAVQNVQAGIVNPNSGSSNPLGGSGLFSFASGHEDVQTSNTQGVREAAVYGGGGQEPMATASAHAKAWCPDNCGGPPDYYLGMSAEARVSYSYIFVDKTTGTFLDHTNWVDPIPLQLTYRMSLSATGDASGGEYGDEEYSYSAIAGGDIYVTGGPFGSIVEVHSTNAAGMGQHPGGDPTVGTVYFMHSLSTSTMLSVTVVAQVSVNARTHHEFVPPDTYVHVAKSARAEAEAVADPYLCIDPASPLAEQLQVYIGKDENADPNNPSDWVPAVQTPVDFSNIIHLPGSLFVIPEMPFGTTILSIMAAFVGFKAFKRIRPKH